MKKMWGAMMAVLTLAMLSVSGARAQILFSLSPTSLTGHPGDHLVLTGTITNTSGGEVFLLGSSGTITGPDNTSLSLDDNDFLNNLPVTLADGAVYQNDLFVDIVVNPTFGSYTLTYGIDGESGDPATPFTQSDSAIIRVTDGSTVPEPGTLGLLGAGLVSGIALLHRRRR